MGSRSARCLTIVWSDLNNIASEGELRVIAASINAPRGPNTCEDECERQGGALVVLQRLTNPGTSSSLGPAVRAAPDLP